MSAPRQRGVGAGVHRIVVVVPASDEENRLGACLESVAVARLNLQAPHRQVEVAVVVVLDDCHDGTAAVAARFPGVDTVVIAARSVGAARRAGVAYALLQRAGPLNQVWIASTDADSRVPPDWLVAICRFADDGHHAVLGTVLPDTGMPTVVEAEWFLRHQRADGHRHIHGANMSVRADVYQAVGGWPAVPTGEDIELARRLASCPGVSILRSGACPVTTSVRRRGRAPDGFAHYLRTLAQECVEQSLLTSTSMLDRLDLADQETIPSS